MRSSVRVAAIAFAGGDCDALKDKSQELLSQARVLVGDGHHAGELIMRDLVGCLEEIQRAKSLLNEARSFAHGIDITVEVPDPEPVE